MELGQERIPIAWVDAETMDEARRIVLVDNKAGTVGGYDEALLLEELRALDGDYDGTGFTLDDETAYQAMLDDDAWDHPDDGTRRGDPDEDQFLPRIDLRVTSQMFDGWRRLLDQYDGEDDRTKLHAHLKAQGVLDV
jgi:hypothetical protein